jgi:monofunctional biosynthetic peptidoglycan transglycosylase
MRIQVFERQIVFVYRSFSTLFSIIGVVVALATAWFVPWVFTLHLGTLVYFPYLPKSESRYTRVTGPWAGPYAENWVSSEAIPKQCKLALVAAEDTKFFDHSGIDFESLEQSYKYNANKNKKSRGGSTITQQIVKNAFLSREKTYLRKAREFIGAILLDAFSSKDMQLTWYFNIVEFGPKVYGIRDAAQFYFKKEAKKLSTNECASLVAILPSPNRWNTSLLKGTPSGFLASRVRVIKARMKILEANQKLLASGNSTTKNSAGPKTNEKQKPAAVVRSEKPTPKASLTPSRPEDIDLPTGPTDPKGISDTEPELFRIDATLPDPPDIFEEHADSVPSFDSGDELPHQKMYEILDPFQNGGSSSNQQSSEN